jgi:hypothetical protein
MEKFDFVLSFSVMADHELDARVKLKDLLKAISKEDIFWAMSPVKKKDLDGADADDLLDMLDLIVNSIDEHVSGDDSTDIDPSLWDDYHKAVATLFDYGRREAKR